VVVGSYRRLSWERGAANSERSTQASQESRRKAKVRIELKESRIVACRKKRKKWEENVKLQKI
jgi:hypothetical protein